MQLNLAEARAVGQQPIQGAMTLGAFRWKGTPGGRRRAQRCLARHEATPGNRQAGVRPGVRRCLRAIRDGPGRDVFNAKVRAAPIADASAPLGTARPDGRPIRDTCLAQEKASAQSTGPLHACDVVGTSAGDQACLPPGDGRCLRVGDRPTSGPASCLIPRWWAFLAQEHASMAIWSSRQPHPENAPGNFYVVDGCCTMCGVPQREAPGVFAPAVNDPSHCVVAKRPCTSAEVGQTLEAIRAAELGCIRYRGGNRATIRKLEGMGEGGQCDAPPRQGVRERAG